MARKYKGQHKCCTCIFAFIKKDESCDPCDVCCRYEYYEETYIQCDECREKDCKYRELEYYKE